jgi:YHS domain-containing protein
MKKLVVIVAVGLFSFALAGDATCGMKDMKNTSAKAAVATEKQVVCPVLKTKIDPKAAAGTSVYKGKTYYFCCSGCKPMFDKNPEKYVKTK